MWIFDSLMSYGNRFAQLTAEAAENAARLVLSQLSESSVFQNIHLTTMKKWSVCNLVSVLIKLNHKE